MCGGVYEEDFNENQNIAPGKDKQVSKEDEQSEMESRDRRVIQKEYVYPGSDCQV